MKGHMGRELGKIARIKIPIKILYLISVLVMICLVLLAVSEYHRFQAFQRQLISKKFDDRNIKLIVTPSAEQGEITYFDGGRGIDVVRLRLIIEEIDQSALLSDLIRFHYFINHNYSTSSSSGSGPVFSFHSINLSVRNIEVLEIDMIFKRPGR